MNVYLNNIWKFLGLFAMQILIVSHLDLSFYVNPYIHILFLLTLPVAIPTAYILILGFVSGLILDTFSDTTGLHAFASVFIAFIRPFMLKVLTPKGSYELIQQPSINSSGLLWFVNYVFIHTLIYLFIYFSLEIFSLKSLGLVFIKTILSTVVSVALMIMLAYLFSPNKKKRAV